MAADLATLRARLHGSAALRPLDVERWGLTVHFRPLSLARQGAIEERFAGRSSAEMVAGMVMLSALDADGAPLFPDDGETLAFLLNEPASFMTDLAKTLKGDVSEKTAGNG